MKQLKRTFNNPGNDFKPINFREKQDEVVPKGLNYEVKLTQDEQEKLTYSKVVYT